MIEIVSGKKIYVERQDDGRYAAYATEDNFDAFGGFCGFGETAAEAVANLQFLAANKNKSPNIGNLIRELFGE